MLIYIAAYRSFAAIRVFILCNYALIMLSVYRSEYLCWLIIWPWWFDSMQQSKWQRELMEPYASGLVNSWLLSRTALSSRQSWK